MKLIRARNEDRASPNGVAGTALIVLLCVCVLCGKTLWVPASRVENLYVRSVLLSIADAVSAFADWTGARYISPGISLRFYRRDGAYRERGLEYEVL